MTTLFLTFALLLVVVAVMAVGVIFSNKPIKGSCGGMAAVGIDSDCEICGGNPKKCEDEQERVANEESDTPFYDASSKEK